MKPVSAESRLRNRAQSLEQPSLGILSQTARLSNGQYALRLSGAGSGWSECRGQAISRWLDDATRDADGFFIYLRDLDGDFVWSAGYQPMRVDASEYQFSVGRGLAQIVRSDRSLECRLAVCVAPDMDLEIRRCTLTNHGPLARRIELTSYLEWVLCGQAADANHPAFSKLFVETQLLEERGTILAKRRPRGADEPEAWGFHAIVAEQDDDMPARVQFETNRASFIGRGRNLARPRALDPGRSLSGQFGPVLDPIASLRTAVHLEPGEAREIAFVLGAAQNRAEIGAALDEIERWSQIEGQFSAAAAVADSKNGELPYTTLRSHPSATSEDIIFHPPHRQDGRRSSDERQARYSPSPHAVNGNGDAELAAPPLEFENGFGGFAVDGTEYHLRIQPDDAGHLRLPPRPWSNIIANEHAGCLVTESGAGYTWVGNSRLNRLTAWHNDAVSDPHAEALWIRDEDERVFWSPTPGPTPASSEYRVRHGFGYTQFEHESHELSQEVTMFMAREEPVKITRVRLVNRSDRARRLSLFSYLHWALGGLVAASAGAITAAFDSQLGAILAINPHREPYGNCVAFSAVAWDQSVACELDHACDRAAFLGSCGDMAAPAAITAHDGFNRQSGNGTDACAAWQATFDLMPGGELEFVFVLGEAFDRAAAAGLINKYRSPSQAQRALDEAKKFWHDTLSAVTIETPHREIDLLVNGWLVYQNLSCRLWGRSAYYQPGGAYGFRDQLQDAAALVLQRPDLTRAQILRHASQQFVEGDMLHWWHPDNGYGLRTRFSDDLLWLPYVTAYYVKTTGDQAVLDEQAPFLVGPTLTADQAEAYLRPVPSGASGSLYDHCCRALDRGLTVGPHGLPLIGCGDWNDGMNRVGHRGQGESVWLGFFICHVLDDMLPICRARADHARVNRYAAYRDRLQDALNTAGWDGDWYRRAYYDNGQPLGSAASDECQIDALAQAWAVISGVAPPDRAASAMQAVDERLVCEKAGMIRLLTPPLNNTPHDPGYIKGYLPGIRENGGQYTHGVLWVVRAMAELGRGSRAVELLKMLSPISHTTSPEKVAIYQTEPYVLAADVYGEPPHVGRGGWTWYTGSAGWMFRIAVESIFGLSIEQGQTLVLNPSISATWPRCRLTYRLPGGSTRYEITIENPAHRQRGINMATVDGESADVEHGIARLPLKSDGGLHRVVVWL